MFAQTHTCIAPLSIHACVFDRKHTMSISIWSLRFAYAYGFRDCCCCCCENESIELKTKVFDIYSDRRSLFGVFGRQRKPAKDGQSDGSTTENHSVLLLDGTAIYSNALQAEYQTHQRQNYVLLHSVFNGVLYVRSFVRFISFSVLFSLLLLFTHFLPYIFRLYFLFYNKKLYL